MSTTLIIEVAVIGIIVSIALDYAYDKYIDRKVKDKLNSFKDGQLNNGRLSNGRLNKTQK